MYMLCLILFRHSFRFLFFLCLVFLTCASGWKILPSGHLLDTPTYGGNVITTNYFSLVGREMVSFFFGIVVFILEKGVMAYRENTKGAIDMILLYIISAFLLFGFVFYYCYTWT